MGQLMVTRDTIRVAKRVSTIKKSQPWWWLKDLALVFLGCWVQVSDHGGSVGYKDGVHHTARNHADHHNPQLYVIWRAKQKVGHFLCTYLFVFF